MSDVRKRIEQLVNVASPLWAGEAEVFRTYWTSPIRTRETDLLWLGRQCFKEFWGSGVGKYDRGGVVLGPVKNLLAKTAEIDITFKRDEIADLLEGVKAEFMHYSAFADAYDALRPAGSPNLNPHSVQGWPEDDGLTKFRYAHQEKFGEIGMRACKFTEGGYCTLFSEGMKLKGKGGADDIIADACAKVYEDEFQHMMGGIAEIGDEGLSDSDWKTLQTLVAEQLRQRILMRNAQFSRPLSDKRIQDIFNGDVKPVEFDYKKAGLA